MPHLSDKPRSASPDAPKSRTDTDDDKIFLAEKMTAKTIDPENKKVRSKRTLQIKGKTMEGKPKDDDSSSASDEEYEKRVKFDKSDGRNLESKSYTLRDRLKKFWITQDMVEKSPDVELRVRTVLSEFFTFLIFVTITLVVVCGKRSISEFHMTDSLRRSLLQTKFRTPQYRTFVFGEIKSAPDIWAFLSEPFTSTVYTDYYFEGDRASPNDVVKVLHESVLVGQPRVRMKANRADSCQIHHVFRRQFISCYDYYSPADENKSDFGLINEKWQWTDGTVDGDSSYWGTFGTYNPGGYVQLLSYDQGSDATNTLNILKRNVWVARRTRILFFDLLVYNTQVNLFCRIQLVFELPPSGGVYPFSSFKTVRLFSYLNTWDYIIGGFELTFAFFTVYYLIEEIREMKFFKWKYFKFFKNYVDLAILACIIYVTIFTFAKAISFAPFIGRIIEHKTIKSGYINLDNYIYYEWLNYKITGILIFLIHIKIFNFLHLTSYMSTLNIVIIRSLNHILGFLIMFGLVFFAFAELGYLLFGTSARQFRSYWASIFTQFKILLGDFDYLELEEADRILGPIFFLAYLFSVFFFLVNMFLAIVNETYVLTRHEKERFGIQHALPIGKYLNRAFWNIFSFLGRPSYAAHEQKRASKALLRVKNALLKCNFTLTEISMFLAKYGIDGKRPTHPHDIHRILKDLERKGHGPMEPPTLDELKLASKGLIGDEDIIAEGRWTGLTLKNFKELMSRLLYIEKQISTTSRRLSNIGEIIESNQVVGTKGEK